MFEIKTATPHPPPSPGAQEERTQSCVSPSVWPWVCPGVPLMQPNYSECHPRPQEESCVAGLMECSPEGLECISGSTTSWDAQKSWSISARLHTGQPALVTGRLWPNTGLSGFLRAPKSQVLCLCCNACILLSLLCLADYLDPHWTSFLPTPTVSLAISLSLTSVFTRKIIERKVTRQSGRHLTASDCQQLSGQGRRHPGREQRWGVRADSIITTPNCPQRLEVTHRSERKMSS